MDGGRVQRTNKRFTLAGFTNDTPPLTVFSGYRFLP
jgi:hypothetical protein